ncbi:unnamed protein product [Ilex paraguariensis]|uniref:Uncharacterized protein n=1 Tax=Ilex paraguariensis TaxID=185542 RepID=A0ABC8RLN6_9AQUA
MLTNRKWGEGGESDDHIVPYPDGSEEKSHGLYRDLISKEWNQEAADIKHAERKKSAAKNESHGGKLEGNSQKRTNEGLHTTGFGMDIWPDLSLSNTAKTDQDSMDTEASNNLIEISQYDSSTGGA